MSCIIIEYGEGLIINFHELKKMKRELERENTYRKMLNDNDYEKFQLNKELIKLFVPGGWICSVGNSMNPWINTVTIYKDYPGGVDLWEQHLRKIDPDVQIKYTTGWVPYSKNRGSIRSYLEAHQQSSDNVITK